MCAPRVRARARTGWRPRLALLRSRRSTPEIPVRLPHLLPHLPRRLAPLILASCVARGGGGATATACAAYPVVDYP